MGYDDPDRDEEGEPIFDPDMQSDEEPPPEPNDDNWDQEADLFSVSAESGEEEAPKAKPRKRLVKKTARESTPDEDEDYRELDGRESAEDELPTKSWKGKDSRDGKSTKEPKKRKSKAGSADNYAKLPKSSKKSERQTASHGGKGRETEMKEMWDSVAGGESEDDIEGERTREDEAFIDDEGVEPEDNLGYSDQEAGSVGDAPQAEEGEEDDLGDIFKSAKARNRKQERSAEETAMLVEQFMARLEVAAEEDAELNRQSKPAINKLKMLPALTSVLSKRQLQQEFLDRGVLSVLKNWLEPLPDGSLPNMTIRSALLKVLTDLPIDMGYNERREQLKKSGLGKVIMFLSKSDEEGTANRKLARDLVDKWSRPIFQKSTRYEELRGYDDERPPPPRPPVKKPTMKATAGFESRGGDDLDLVDSSQDPKPGQPGYRIHASRPEALPLDFVVRPHSKIDPDEIRARAKQQRLDERRMKMNKKLQQLKAPKKKKLQASKISVEGRGLVKYF